MKTLRLLILSLLAALLISGCDFLDNFTSASDDGSESTDEESEETTSIQEVYADLVVEVMEESNELLNKYTNLIDMMHTQSINRNEFRSIIRDIIPDSNDILTKLDTVIYDIDDGLYDYHRSLIELMNFQHQMFLTSLSMANDTEKEIDLINLREMYVDVKKEQTELIQEIKQIFSEMNQIQEIEG